jgi:long-chain acyl-CoA synthetase
MTGLSTGTTSDTAPAKEGRETNPLGTMPWFSAYPKDLAWRQDYVAEPVHGLLEQAVARFPACVCTYFLGRTMTYAEIGRAVDHAAAGLQKLGVGRGVKVGLFLPNTPTFVVAYYAVLKAGGTVVNFNPLYSIPELEHQVRDSGTPLMITLDLKLLFDKVETLLASGVLERAVVANFASLLPTLKSALFRIARGQDVANVRGSSMRPKIVLQSELMANDGKPAPAVIDPDRDLAVLQYTGGTTGTPKGAMLTHANVGINVQQVSHWAGSLGNGTETVMAILPFFHVFGMTVVMNFGVQRASRLILVPKFELGEAVKLMAQLKPTILPGVPTLFNAILNHRSAKTADLRSLKWCFSGGAPLPLETKRRFEAMTGAILIEGYGLSETSPVVTGNPPDGPIKEGSIGLPLPATYVSIRSLEDPAREMPVGETGEICLAGPQVMSGYWNKEAETADSFTTGPGGPYFRTGDIGHMDAEGFTYISDRLKDMINASGFKVYPRRIEDALYEHPAVEEAVVIGIPDAYRGEAPKAFIKLREGRTATAEELMAFLKPKLAKTELPEEIEFRASLPKTAVGKLSKKELKVEEQAKRANT